MEIKGNKCNHNPNDSKTSLKKLQKRIMTYPPIQEYVCTVCHKFFEVEKKAE